MIQALTGFPSKVAAFLCSGRVTAQEYGSVLIPTASAALQAHRKVRLYYETAADFSIDPGAVWEDFTFGIEHLMRWERVAVVTDTAWLLYAVRAFSFLLPGRVKVFATSARAQARQWIIGET